MRKGWARSVPLSGSAVFLIALGTAVGQSTAADPVQQHIRLAEQDLRNHDLAGAEHEYRAILTADPLNGEAWTGLGVLLYGSGRTQAASEALGKALGIDPGSQ